MRKVLSLIIMGLFLQSNIVSALTLDDLLVGDDDTVKRYIMDHYLKIEETEDRAAILNDLKGRDFLADVAAQRQAGRLYGVLGVAQWIKDHYYAGNYAARCKEIGAHGLDRRTYNTQVTTLDTLIETVTRIVDGF